MSSTAATASTMARVGVEAKKRNSTAEIVAASMVGTAIEFYDNYCYSIAAASYFGLIFFTDVAKSDPVLATLLSFVTFAVSFLARPFGSLLFGHFGDKLGRKKTLVVALMLMGIATFVVGLLPGYEVLGPTSVVLLCVCRACQGLGLGGEWSGAALVATENAPKNKRALYGSFPNMGAPIGFFCAYGVNLLLDSTLPADAMVAWGWRIPFWLALPLGYITHYIRTHLEDSPVYAQMQERMKEMGEKVEHPIRTLFTKHLRVLLISFGACVLNAVGFYAVLTYLPNYLETTLNYPPSDASTITTIVLVVYIAFIFLSGRVSDKVGRKKMLIGACVGFILFTVPAFMLLGTMNFWVILIVELFMCLLLTINDGTLASYLTETFPTDVRYSGFALSFNLANAIFGGSASFISFWLIDLTGNAIAPAWYMVAIAVVAFVAMCMTHDHSGKKLDDVK